MKAYLEVERLRLGDRLRITMHIEPQALQVPIPILCIQPLVENAVKHGVAPQSQGGIVSIHAAIENGSLRIAVEDNGGGFSGKRRGIGLENVAKRMELCYGPAARLDVESSAAGSTVRLSLPAQASQFTETMR